MEVSTEANQDGPTDTDGMRVESEHRNRASIHLENNGSKNCTAILA
jgi:hypothetical protein